MNLLDTVAVTSRSFSKNKGLVNDLKAKYSKDMLLETYKNKYF
jgi:hypothetical protein